MTKRIVIAISLIVIITSTVVRANRVYNNYIPALSSDCATSKAGIAWLGGPSMDDLKSLCAWHWYAIGSHTRLGQRGAIPVIRPMTYDRVVSELSHDFDSFMLVTNEPNLCTQDCMTPEQTCDFIAQVKFVFPDAKIVAPNVFNTTDVTSWLMTFVATCEGSVDVWSVHIYDQEPNEDLAMYCQVIPCADGIWVTEYGYDRNDPNPYANMRKWTSQLQAHESVDRYFAWYDGGPYWPDRDFRLIINGQLTEVGRGFVDARFGGYP